VPQQRLCWHRNSPGDSPSSPVAAGANRRLLATVRPVIQCRNFFPVVFFLLFQQIHQQRADAGGLQSTGDKLVAVAEPAENAVSVASVLLLTEATLTEIPEPKAETNRMMGEE
jgi:hypothetical protein